MNHCVASSYSSGPAAAFPAAVGTALGKGEQRGAWGPNLGMYLGGQRLRCSGNFRKSYLKWDQCLGWPLSCE